MRKFNHHFRWIIALFLLSGILLSACSQPVTPGISGDEIRAKVDNLLVGMNEDDYDKFSQDLSPKMKEAMGPSQFEDLRKTVFDASGKYVSLSEDKPENLSQQGYVVYSYFSNFEKEEVKVTISLADGGNQIEGLFFDSKNLRQGTTQ